MLTSIHIQGFKGFKDTKIEPLRRVNLIVGGQNSGKTSLLEAIEVGFMLDDEEFSNYVENAEEVAYHIKNFLSSLSFRNNIGKRQADSISGKTLCKIDTKYSKVLTGSPQSSTFSVYPVDEKVLVQLYDMAVKNLKNKSKKRLTDLLKKIEPRLESIESVAADGESSPSLHVDIGLDKLTPISMLGQGFNRLTYLYAGLLGQGSEYTLIDELENGIHYSALPTVWQGIANIARELDIQLFITTHSKECIVAATEVFKDTPDEFQLIRLEREADNVIAKCIPHERVNNVLDMGLEVR